MTRTVVTSSVLAVPCAGPVAASANLSQAAGVPPANQMRVAHQNFAHLRVAVPERPTVFPSARPQPYPYNYHETDGLSRNPNDCVVWGCIDSN